MSSCEPGYGSHITEAGSKAPISALHVTMTKLHNIPCNVACIFCRENGTSSGETYLGSPSLVWVTEGGGLAMGDLPSTGGYRGRRVGLQPKYTLPLGPSESVLQASAPITSEIQHRT